MSTYRLLLKQIRKDRGLTQRDVAEKANVSLGTYRTWEQGTSGMSLEMACRIAVVLGCTPNDICGWYIDHPEDRPAPPGEADSEASELVRAYRSCTPERKESLLNLARDSALLSGFAAERRQAQEVV